MTTQSGDVRNGARRPFPARGLDGFLSHFIVSVEFRTGDLADRLLTFTLPAAVQTVARSDPFIFDGAEARHSVEFPLPERSALPRRLAQDDFLVQPEDVFRSGSETVWLQILNLDARGDTPVGPVRIILGETFQREYPEVFQPSFGAAQSLNGEGFPARLFFSPNAVIETPLGAFKTRPKALVGDEVSEFPPVGSYPRLLEPVEIDSVEEISRVGLDRAGELEAAGQIVGLSHPIDALLLSGDPFERVERTIG
jgi:hypothetical protein